MNHDAYREQLSALLDGELGEEARAEALSHLETCEDCRQYFAELTAMHDAFDDMEPIDVPAGFARGVLLRLHEESAPRAWAAKEPEKRTAWRRWTALAACAAVVVLAVTALPNIRMGGAAPASGSSSSSVQYAGVSADSAPAELYAADTTVDAPMLAESKQALDGGTPAAGAAMAKVAEEEAPAEFTTNTAAAPEAAYDAEMDALREAEPMDEAPTMTLTGEGAAEWLAAHGEDLGDGRWRVAVEDVNALPDTLELVAEDDIQRPTEGTLVITLGSTEEQP